MSGSKLSGHGLMPSAGSPRRRRDGIDERPRHSPVRAALTVLHRYVGLAIATFLFIAGSTGAIIAWDHELDALLNPALMRTSQTGTPIPPAEVARGLEARDPRIRVAYLPIATEPGMTLSVFVQPRVDPKTGQLFSLDFNQVFFNPVTGQEIGRREWGQAWPITGATLIPFLYKLHYSLHLPPLWGEPRVGLWLMGSITAVWFLDCFVGFYLTLPRRPRSPRAQELLARSERGWWARWTPAWKIKTGGSGYRVAFDIHRAFGLWTWALLLVVAFSGFSLALNAEILRPVLSKIANLTPTPLDGPARAVSDKQAPLDMVEIVAHARAEGGTRGIKPPLGAISYDVLHDIYSALFFQAGEHGGEGGVEPHTLYMDSHGGHVLGARQPWAGTTADIFLQAQFPLHSGRILGLFGRILVSIIGVAVAALSASGVIIWWRKRAARTARQRLHVVAATRV